MRASTLQTLHPWRIHLQRGCASLVAFDDNQHELVNEREIALAGLRFLAQHLDRDLRRERAADLASARAAFGALSDAMLAAGKNADGGFGDNVKIAYCPMAKKYWLQKGEAIRNPYYGKAMSDCGRLSAPPQ